MYVVAYLYNRNGMASWCWEAAHALHEAGFPVLLVCSPEVELPGNPEVKILRFRPEPEGKRTKTWLSLIQNELGRLSAKPSGFLKQLQQTLQAQHIQPTAYFLNQSDLQDPEVETAQHVVAWAYPTSLSAYLSKLGRLAGWELSKTSIRTCLGLIGWWRKDWRAYRSAASVLAVSQRLCDELVQQGISSRVVYPGTQIRTDRTIDRPQVPARLLIAAVGLEEPRKRVRWMLEALSNSAGRDYSLTLVGGASPSFQTWVAQLGLPATFTGMLSRSELQHLMLEHDIFLFGSCLDDWGYVLVEAMSQGLCVIAPDMTPFDEIVGHAGALYAANSQQDFSQKLAVLVSSDLLLLRRAALARSQTLFSRQAFGQNLIDHKTCLLEIS